MLQKVAGILPVWVVTFLSFHSYEKNKLLPLKPETYQNFEKF